MDEPVVTPVVEPVTPAVEPVVEPVVAPVTPTAFFGTDGILNEGWQGTLDESLREEKSLAGFKNVNDLSKSFVMTKKMVGANVIPIPTDISTEDEWQEFHKAGGRPETAADYGFKKHDEIPDNQYSQEYVTGLQDLLFKFGASSKLASALVEYDNQFKIAMNVTKAQNKELAKTELVSGLATDWGVAFEQNKHLGNMAIEEGTLGDGDFKERLTKKFGDDPDFIRYSSNLGKKFAEGKPPGFGAIPTPSDYQDQIDRLMEDPLYTKGTQAQRMKIADKIMALRKLQKPEPAITV